MSDSRPHYNMNNPSVRRIMKEIKEMQAEKSTLYTAMPLDVSTLINKGDPGNFLN